ncbi:MAG TPA: hypothetical protein VGL81_15145 [Polyangiaceae bacterium]|jgi:hypothetical protein
MVRGSVRGLVIAALAPVVLLPIAFAGGGSRALTRPPPLAILVPPTTSTNEGAGRQGGLKNPELAELFAADQATCRPSRSRLSARKVRDDAGASMARAFRRARECRGTHAFVWGVH